MTWFKVDDKLWGHQKWVSATPGARALWVTAGSWAADHLTDGFVPRHLLGIFGARLADARKLVEIGLWLEVEGGWQFHDWLKFQPSKEKVEEKREDARQRQHEARERKRAEELSQRDDDVTHDVTSRDVTQVSQPPDPTRPDPTVLPSEEPNTNPRRYPDDFEAFWAIYPRKKAKDAAFNAWKAALKRAPAEDIIAGAKRYAEEQHGKDPKYLKYPQGWLSGGRWADEADRDAQPQQRYYGKPGERKAMY